MQIPLLGLSITRTPRTKQAPPPNLRPIDGRLGPRGWFPLISESFPGAWQKNITVDQQTVLTYAAVFACVTAIASDVSKLPLRLVQQDDAGVWTETSSPAFSPVLRRPNRYQTTVWFIEQWMTSKLIHGNTYVLKVYDGRGVVTEMYVLDPLRVRPLIAPDGSIWYELRTDLLSNIGDTVTVPARVIIHDTMVALQHPLCGVSPLTACGLAATQGLQIQQTATRFFANGSQPGGVLTAPGTISQEVADRLKTEWETKFGGDNAGKVAILGDGLTYASISVNAVDAQLIEQLKWTAEQVCTAYHVPAYMIGIGAPPPYANIEPLLQQYYNQCIQILLTKCERALDNGLGIYEPIQTPAGPVQYGTEFDIDDLIWMDSATRTKAAREAIQSGGVSPNEARRKYFGLGPIAGGASAYMQNQMWPLQQLESRPTTTAPAAPPAPPAPPLLPPARAARIRVVEGEVVEDPPFAFNLAALEGHLDRLLPAAPEASA